MRKTLVLFFLCCLILLGCAPEVIPEETTAGPAETMEATLSVPDGYYDPDSDLEQSTGGAVRCYPLIGLNSTGVMPLQENLLVFSCTETSTTLTLLSGETLYPTASMELNMVLTSSNYSLRTVMEGFSFYDESTGDTVLLDEMLRQTRRIPAPEDLCGIPLLSTDCSTLYYCTTDSVRALDLESGISRCLKEMTYSFQYTKGLWLDDSILECYTSNGSSGQTLFLSTETGQLLGSAGESFSFHASEEHYYAATLEGSKRQFLFGSPEEPTRTLIPRTEPLDVAFLPDSHGIVTTSMDEGFQLLLEHYDLNTGFRNSQLQLTTEYFPWDFYTTPDGQVGFLNYDESYGCNVLYRWDIRSTISGDDTVYTDNYYTREAPDHEELAECALYAQQIGEKYGIEVLIYKDAAAVQPWDYDLEYEHLTGVLRRELILLDEHLSNYPEGFLSTLADRFDGLKICIVRSLNGSAESGSLDSANGIQFTEGRTAYIALSASENTEYALYHEMCHLIDTVVITESGAYDRWDELNPSGFAYDYDYIANQSRNSSAYLQENSRYFIDNYSMSFPKEDRARIMEYAMTEGNESYFRSPTMQAKLKLLCEGIREAFGLKESPETFLWEQYLNVSLAYTG